MNVAIVWDTKRENKATHQMVLWLSEFLSNMGIHVETFRPAEFQNQNFDLIVIGTPIYYEKPMKSILTFLESHKSDLKNKKIALFILGWANKSKRFDGYVKRKYIAPLIEKISGTIIEPVGRFRGWIRKLDNSQKEEIETWIQDILDQIAIQES